MNLGSVNANEFKKNNPENPKTIAEKYILKLVPDFGVFDIAEKYFVDNNRL